MGLSVKTGNFVANTSTGSQSITGVGFLPKIIILYWTGATATGAGAMGADEAVGWGAYDGTNEVCNILSLEDASSAADDRAINTKIIRIGDTGGAVDFDADGTSFDADGFTINISTTGAVAYIISYLVLGGSDITNVVVGSFIIGTGSTTSESMSFQADCLIFGGVDSAASFPGNGNGNFGIGYATSTTSTDQHAMSGRKRSGSNVTYSGYKEGRCLIFADDSATPNAEYHVSTLSASEFILTKDVGGTRQAAVIYIAIKGPKFERGAFQSPTSATTSTISGLAFDPLAVLFDTGGHTGADTFSSEMLCSIGAMTGSADEFTIFSGHADTNLHDSALKTDKVITTYMPGTPTLLDEAEFSSFGANEFVVNWTTADASQRRIGFLAIGAAAVGGVTVDSWYTVKENPVLDKIQVVNY